ncbi:MAG: ATP-binding cassette domain-containing protein [Rhodospirillales bacterium]|nr:ATP-binding cassette domain-containing protein [Rhodospirillales bacterium]
MRESVVLDLAETRRRAEPAMPHIGVRPGSAIEVASVSKRFGDKLVLRGVDLKISAGEFTAIVGHSGCGKSTLLRLIAGLDAATAGTISINGQVVSGQVRDARMMFQEARLLPWRRVLDNVGIGLPRGWQTSAQAALEAVGLGDRGREWPAVLSGGQRQRVSLARALVSHPHVLLLDEPLGALDALTRIEMQDLLERVWQAQGFTAVLVTHDVAEAVALADRVIVLENGINSAEWHVPHGRPRDRGSAELAKIQGAILDRLTARRWTTAASAGRASTR